MDASQLESLRAQLAATVTHWLAQYGHQLALVVRANPQGGIVPVLARPDLAGSLRSALAAGERQALAAVGQAWHAGAEQVISPVFDRLRQDVRSAYAQAPGQIEQAVTEAWEGVPSREFRVGIDAPGTNPAAEAAAERAQAAQAAVSREAQSLALRNGLSVDVAASSSRTAATLAGASPRAGKRWVASMDGRDPRSCAWCRRLHGTIVSVNLLFPDPEAIGGRKPPRPYGPFRGPPLHPHCQCRVEVVPAPEAAAPPPVAVPEPEPDGFISSEDIRDMPEERYQSFRSFLRSALHELGQVIKAILGIGAGQ